MALLARTASSAATASKLRMIFPVLKRVRRSSIKFRDRPKVPQLWQTEHPSERSEREIRTIKETEPGHVRVMGGLKERFCSRAATQLLGLKSCPKSVPRMAKRTQSA